MARCKITPGLLILDLTLRLVAIAKRSFDSTPRLDAVVRTALYPSIRIDRCEEGHAIASYGLRNVGPTYPADP